MKICSGCHQDKPLSEYHIMKSSKDGLKGRCGECCNRANREHYKTYIRDKKKQAENRRRWKLKNIVATKAERRRYREKYSFSINFSKQIGRSLMNGKSGNSWKRLVGYTVSDLKSHLEKQFHNGMTWANYGVYGWHIDHKIPITAFNLKTYETIDFKKCWALDNLQPLWAKENISKSNKLEKPFQPSLI